MTYKIFLRKCKSISFLLYHYLKKLFRLIFRFPKEFSSGFIDRIRRFPDILTKYMIDHRLPKYISKNIASIDLHAISSKGKRVAFIPYQSPDCIIQHAYMANILKLYGCETSIITPSVPNLSNSNRTFITNNFSDLISHLIKLFGSNPIFLRGVLDEFIRICNVNVFKGAFRVEDKFLNQMDNANDYSQKIIHPFDAIVLADSAYSLNRAVRSNSHLVNKPVFALNPHGQWKHITKYEDENFSLIRFDQIINDLEDGNEAQYKEATMYLEKRFSGKSSSDLDSRKIFAKAMNRESLLFKTPKKVLFLHSFRDASGLSFPDNPDELFFPTYFQWTDAALSIISSNQEDWIIKPHPSQGYYPNDNEILDFLLNKHNINRSIVNTELSTLYVLKHKWHIYTCSGTIAQEAACFGFKAHTVSGRIPNLISSRAKTLAEFEAAYAQPISTPPQIIENEIHIKAAKIFFAEQYSGSQLFARAISPKNPVLPSLSKVNIYLQKCRALWQMNKMCKSEDAFVRANSLSLEILEKINCSKV